MSLTPFPNRMAIGKQYCPKRKSPDDMPLIILSNLFADIHISRIPMGRHAGYAKLLYDWEARGIVIRFYRSHRRGLFKVSQHPGYLDRRLVTIEGVLNRNGWKITVPIGLNEDEWWFQPYPYYAKTPVKPPCFGQLCLVVRPELNL